MYVCGPTVYNYIHVGNSRSTVAFDTIRRYLEYRGYDVNYVSNFTDVDDKIIRTAKEMKITPVEVAEKFIAAFAEDTQALRLLRLLKFWLKRALPMNHTEMCITVLKSLKNTDN